MQNELPRHVDAMRRFNRFYTRKIGVLHEGLLRSPFALTEARLLFELAQQEDTTASDLGADLGLDAGYLSRVLRRLQESGLIDKRPSKIDGRQSLLSLSDAGREAFSKLDADSRTEVGSMLGDLSVDERDRLVRAMHTIEALLGFSPEQKVPYILRPHQPGDMGWVVHRHGVLYAQEYGFDEQFEALVAGIVSNFIQSYDPKRERCWIAEKDGEIVGSVFMVTKTKTVGKLRLLLVEPKARGLGIGKRLVDECVRFARRVRYRKITLWTNVVLHAARHIYEEAGFELIREEPHHSFGCDLVGQTWEKQL